MGLKVKKKYDDSWQRCCKYCKHFEEGRCNKNVVNADQVGVYNVSENGYAAQAIEEVLDNEDLIRPFMRDLMEIFDKWNLSQKKKQEFQKHFKECWSQFADMSLKGEIDEQVMKCYAMYVMYGDDAQGITITDPTNFVCADWE